LPTASLADEVETGGGATGERSSKGVPQFWQNVTSCCASCPHMRHLLDCDPRDFAHLPQNFAAVGLENPHSQITGPIFLPWSPAPTGFAELRDSSRTALCYFRGKVR